MSLWARFTARWKARKAERLAIAARMKQDRAEAQANLRRALAVLESRDGGVVQTQHIVLSHMVYQHGASETQCNPDVSGSCSGMGV
jgi:hypothetical protein